MSKRLEIWQRNFQPSVRQIWPWSCATFSMASTGLRSGKSLYHSDMKNSNFQTRARENIFARILSIFFHHNLYENYLLKQMFNALRALPVSGLVTMFNLSQNFRAIFLFFLFFVILFLFSNIFFSHAVCTEAIAWTRFLLCLLPLMTVGRGDPTSVWPEYIYNDCCSLSSNKFERTAGFPRPTFHCAASRTRNYFSFWNNSQSRNLVGLGPWNSQSSYLTGISVSVISSSCKMKYFYILIIWESIAFM